MAIRAAGGGIAYDFEYREGIGDRCHDFVERPEPGPTWLKSLIGPEYFREVVLVNMQSNEVSLEFVELINGLQDIQWLSFADSNCQDAHFFGLRPWPKVRILYLSKTKVGSATLPLLGKCRSLEYLDLSHTQVTNENTSALAGLRHLEVLRLEGTSMGDVGVASISESQSIEYLDLSDTDISDQALSHVQRMKSLRTVLLVHTRVSYEARRELADKLPELEIVYHP
jgi:Leucine-rich repeat (LRR) protein